MHGSRPKFTQIVDWRAAFFAGLTAGTVFLLLNLFVVPGQGAAGPWVMLRLFGSMLLGKEVLAPPATFHAGALAAAVATLYVLSFAAAALLAVIIHRYGLWVGILGGALYGLALFAINMYTLTYFFPQFLVLNGMPFLWAHVIFGALAGGVYEALEVERFVPVDEGVAS